MSCIVKKTTGPTSQQKARRKKRFRGANVIDIKEYDQESCFVGVIEGDIINGKDVRVLNVAEGNYVIAKVHHLYTPICRKLVANDGEQKLVPINYNQEDTTQYAENEFNILGVIKFGITQSILLATEGCRLLLLALLLPYQMAEFQVLAKQIL